MLIILLRQAVVIFPLLTRFGITLANLGYFVLDNALNNDTTLQELGRKIGFDPKTKRLRCMGHILNLLAEAYVFGQDVTRFQKDYDAARPPKRRQMWRQRREVSKLYNLVTHVMASGKRSDLFTELQKECNTGITEGKL